MTTMPDPAEGGDADDLPFLPPARPVAPAPTLTDDPVAGGPSAPARDTDVPGDGAAVPVVPAPAPVAPHPLPAQPATFDARAMVESQKRVNTSPAYGAMPTRSDSSREATEKLRAAAQKKRRRNRWTARFVGVVVLGGLGAAGWFGYQEFVAEQDDEPVAAEPDRSAAEILDDMGSQGEMINAQDALNDAVVPNAGGFSDAIADARDVVGDLNGNDDVVGDDGDGDRPSDFSIVDPSTVRSHDFYVRRWSTSSRASPATETLLSYDRTADTYLGSTVDDDPATTDVLMFGTDDVHQMVISTDGRVERWDRSPESLAPAPDFPIARLLRVADVLPPSAEPFARRQPTRVILQQGEATLYELFTDRWRAADPAAHASWLELWRDPVGEPALVVPESREVYNDSFDIEPMSQIEVSITLDDLTGGPTMMLVLETTDGFLRYVEIVAPADDFRSVYVLETAYDDPVLLSDNSDRWLAAP